MRLTLNYTQIHNIANNPEWQRREAVELRRSIARIVGEELLKSSNRAFEKETAPDGTRWAPRSPQYLQRLIKRGEGGKKILTRRSFLKNSRRVSTNENGALLEAGGNSTNLRYARIHQLGGRAGRNHRSRIPARPYLGLDRRGEQKIILKVQEALKRYAERALKSH